jgi:hypothetical protein
MSVNFLASLHGATSQQIVAFNFIVIVPPVPVYPEWPLTIRSTKCPFILPKLSAFVNIWHTVFIYHKNMFGLVAQQETSQEYRIYEILHYSRGAQILIPRQLWQLNFVWWHLIILFVDPQYGTCFMSTI